MSQYTFQFFLCIYKRVQGTHVCFIKHCNRSVSNRQKVIFFLPDKNQDFFGDRIVGY